MLILALDTSTPAGSFALLEDSRVRGVISRPSQETYASRLFQELETLFRETDVSLKDIDLYAVAAGPGTFTGLRVGLTAVKGWAEIFEKPVAAISSLEAVASIAETRCQFIVPVLDARRGELFTGLYRREGGRLSIEKDERVTTPTAFLGFVAEEAAQRNVCIATPDYELVSRMFPREGTRAAEVVRVSSCLAAAVGHLGYERAQRGALADALTLDANYIRRSDAELMRKNQ